MRRIECSVTTDDSNPVRRERKSCRGRLASTARKRNGRGGSLWEQLSAPLDALEMDLRVRVVGQLARYLTYQQVPFLPEFWRAASGRRWVEQLEGFLQYFVERDPQQKLDILDGPIRTGDFARHTKEGESRERLREAFNTPLYPMILIANEVMQENLDLHKHCRRIVHHNLVWNPAQVEQRIGRIDRLGSLTNRLRKNGEGVTLDVLYPFIRGTIDDRLFRTVERREKWLEFLPQLLGVPPHGRGAASPSGQVGRGSS